MAKFGTVNGSAIKDKAPSYTFKGGDNKVRLVGDILPRYVYWIKGTNDKDIPVECLGFDRDSERFLNSEKDWVRHYYPDLKCGWAYSLLCIDYSGEEGPKVVVFNLKKKLFEQIKVAAEDLGDPTDLDNGWDVYFKKVKTGPSTFNVEYTLQVAKCMNGKRALTDEEKALVADSKSIFEYYARPTPEEQKELLERIRQGVSSAKSNNDPEDAKEAAGEFDD